MRDVQGQTGHGEMNLSYLRPISTCAITPLVSSAVTWGKWGDFKHPFVLIAFSTEGGPFAFLSFMMVQ